MVCGSEIIQKKTARRKRKTCEICTKKKLSNYYKNWYAENGRNRSGSYSTQVMEWKRKNPEKVAAHKIVAGALKGGIIKNPGECSVCGKKTTYLDAHHDDYDNPLKIRWLCISCHRQEHSKH